MSSPQPKPPHARYLSAFFRALTDEATYDVRRNPSIWLGFLLAIPIPVLTFAGGSALWLKLLSLLSPVTWGVILGAAGRVGIIAQQAKQQLETEVVQVRSEAAETAQALGHEVERRTALEKDRDEVLAELKLAHAVQLTLMPDNIQRSDSEVVVRQIPSRYVGGDYVHTVVVEDRWLYLCVADVSGHGIAAALVVARMHGLVRRLTLTKKTPEGMLERINRAALSILKHTYFFMTFGVFRIDLLDGKLDYATAGHPAQILLRADGSLEPLRTPNRLLGMDADIFSETQPSRHKQLQPGDSLILFTDGLFEVLADGKGEVLGEDGFEERIRGLGPLPPSMLAGEVLQDLADFQGRSDFEDDVSLVVARYLGRPAKLTARESRGLEAPRRS